MTVRDEALLAVGYSRIHWSADGDEWQPAAADGSKPFSYVRVAGKDSAGTPLLGDWNTVYSITAGGELSALDDVPGSAHVNTSIPLDDGRSLIGSDTGLWLTPTDDDEAAELVGAPGDHVRRIFHLHDGNHASVSSGPGYAHLAKLDDASGTWTRQVLHEFGVNDVVELPGGDRLLATSWAYEGGYGSLFRWRSGGELEQILNTRSVISAIVADDGSWMISTDDRMDDRFHVLVSDDEGETWAESRLDTEGPQTLVKHCGNIYAVGPAGLYRLNGAEWDLLAGREFAFVGAKAYENGMLLHSGKRLWHQDDCEEGFLPVPLPQGTELNDVALDATGSIWAVTRQGGMYLAHGATEWKWFDEALPEGQRLHVTVDADGFTWIRVRDEGVFSGRPL